MFPNEDLQRWAGRVCLLLVGALGMMGYHFANVRFLPLMAGFAILADGDAEETDGGEHPT